VAFKTHVMCPGCHRELTRRRRPWVDFVALFIALWTIDGVKYLAAGLGLHPVVVYIVAFACAVVMAMLIAVSLGRYRLKEPIV